MESANFFVAVMAQNDEQLVKIEEGLANEFGSLFHKNTPFFFTFTDYYKEEFGDSLKKVFLIFEKKISKTDLIALRKRTGEIEQDFSVNGKRTINLDPGYLSQSELVLASIKHKPYRELLGEGVFAQKMMEFKKGQVRFFPHTFQDYKLYADFFKGFINTL